MVKQVMADGRAFTIYSPSCSLNQYYQDKHNVKNAHEYRQFLQQNAQKLMDELKEYSLGEAHQVKYCCNCKRPIKKE
jgi:nucleoid-associated protein YejK